MVMLMMMIDDDDDDDWCMMHDDDDGDDDDVDDDGGDDDDDHEVFLKQCLKLGYTIVFCFDMFHAIRFCSSWVAHGGVHCAIFLHFVEPFSVDDGFPGRSS